MAPSALQLGSLSLLFLSAVVPSLATPTLLRRAAVNSAALPTGWSYKGCYVDMADGRALSSSSYVSATAMTEEACAAFCGAGGFKYAGVEYSQECYCGGTLTAAVGAEADCSMVCTGNAGEVCGGPNRLNIFENTQITGPVVNPGPGAWGTMGCYSDVPGARTLQNQVATTGGQGALTVELCVSACAALNYKLAGVEYGGECYCDNALANGGAPAPDGAAQCNMPCNGAAGELCGGPFRLNVYGLNYPKPSSTSTSSAAPPAATGWVDMGCYTDSVAARTLSQGGVISGGPAAMTQELCQAACKNAGFTFAGVEYSGECYCDSQLRNGGGPAPDGNALCNMPCNGNSKEMCGGPNRLNMYQWNGVAATTAPVSTTAPATTAPSSASSAATAAPSSIAGWSGGACYTDTQAVRSLPNGVPVPGGAAAMTIDLCTAACKAAGYTIAGVEYAAECYCGNAFAAGGPAPDGQAQCNMPCNGNAAQICGGPNRLNVYFYGGAGSSSSSSSISSSIPSTTAPPPTSTASTASATFTPPSNTLPANGGTATNLPAGWTYKGCWVDNQQGRIMNGPLADTATMTVESCIATCAAAGYSVAGLQYSAQCFCDNQLQNAATLAATDGTCAMKCSGSTTEICGGPNLDSVYSSIDLVVLQPASSQTTGLPGNWVYKGCLMDQTPRSLPEQIIYKTTNQASVCLSLCAEYGYNAAGMEYGEECYCGDKGDPGAAGAVFVAESECGVVCPGNARYMCGAGNRLSYYEWEGTPLVTYGYPQGVANTGEYIILGNAPVIALITTQGTNGKVTFVEKSGTSTTPGSTGAYEFDISTNTYRTMHVKTDVFCSAGVTLPDKVGRQMNIGGWSGDSTYGIRIYWPDGAPGVPSTNDWQENFQELALQNGRWYPSAMIMANGSILVVGGENGSNGPPVPTLELLPRAGGALYMDWLKRTDPYNLYPYLAVLPSGGIFVAYYNEAIILDEVTFATTKQLPNIPAGVTNPAGGRTYPLEGTMVLLPQHAPYSDPLGVLICGGSTPFGGHAIDNCVSTTPESAAPVWTIEKMPSKRVLTCMTALPDGTYLILNGAHQGVAGFGLAQDANHNAILYDPTKPVNARMSMMANSTIDRFYHSEAILLSDGRILVSGSDPETDGLIQETRVEVFVPPYLKTGQAQPSFTITNKDWKHGETITVTVTLSGGGPVRFSLMGAESSTHGNSMGQRTIFPEVTCNGNTCQIVAPPTAHICPPGWFQLFLLDGPVPSHSTYVRIGGDPADLGAWPVEPDFTIPGSG